MVASPGSMGDSLSAASECGDGLRQRLRSEAVSFDLDDEAEEESGEGDEDVDPVYEVVDWGIAERQ